MSSCLKISQASVATAQQDAGPINVVNNTVTIQALPFTLATQRKRQLKADLEARLQELTECHTLLRQEGVLVSL